MTTTICVNAGFSGGALLFDDAGGSPTDRLWFVRVRIGLDSGDAIQYARFDFWLLDNAIAAEVATYRAPGYHWGAVGQYTYSDTLTAHIGGTFDLGVTITNSPDTANQCFIVLARAAWVIDG